MTERFLFASSLQHAKSSADIDYGWQQIGQFEWRDDEGEIVRIVRDARGLYGQPLKVLYLGYEAWRNGRDFREVIDLADARGATIIGHHETIRRVEAKASA